MLPSEQGTAEIELPADDDVDVAESASAQDMPAALPLPEVLEYTMQQLRQELTSIRDLLVP